MELSSSSSSTVQSSVSASDLYSSSKCLSPDSDLESLVNNSERIFTLYAPRTGGFAMNKFAMNCPGAQLKLEHERAMFDDEARKNIVTGNTAPKLLSFHSMFDRNLIKLVQSVTNDSLIIYSHQSETERLVAAIKYVVENRYCGTDPLDEKYLEDGIRTEEECVVFEHNLLRMIEDRVGEIGGGNIDHWTCDTFDAIEENKPNFVLYSKHHLDKLQSAFAKKYCPELEGENMHIDDDSSKSVIVRFGEQSSHPTHADILLEDWIEQKKDLLEWSLDLYKNGSCRGKLRDLEMELSSCGENHGGVGIVLSSVP